MLRGDGGRGEVAGKHSDTRSGGEVEEAGVTPQDNDTSGVDGVTSMNRGPWTWRLVWGGRRRSVSEKR